MDATSEYIPRKERDGQLRFNSDFSDKDAAHGYIISSEKSSYAKKVRKIKKEVIGFSIGPYFFNKSNIYQKEGLDKIVKDAGIVLPAGIIDGLKLEYKIPDVVMSNQPVEVQYLLFEKVRPSENVSKSYFVVSLEKKVMGADEYAAFSKQKHI